MKWMLVSALLILYLFISCDRESGNDADDDHADADNNSYIEVPNDTDYTGNENDEDIILKLAESSFGYSVAVDNQGGVFVAGATFGDLDGNTNAGITDVFLIKLGNDGKKIWTKQWGTKGEESGNSVDVDNEGNVYLTGSTTGNLDGNINASGIYDIFLTKFSNDGTKIWTRQWGTKEKNIGNSVKADKKGNIYVTGVTHGNLDGNINASKNCDDFDCPDIFLTKFSSDGKKIWTKQWGTEEEDFANEIAVDNAGNIFVTGVTHGSLDGNTFAGGQCGSESCADLFLSKFNEDGTKIWTRQWGGTGSDEAEAVTVDKEDNIIITGSSYSCESSIVLDKFDNDGVQIWSKRWWNYYYEGGTSVAIDNENNIFVAGSTYKPIDNNDIIAGGNCNGHYCFDIILIKLDSDGSKVWNKQWGLVGMDYGESVAIDNENRIFVVGTIAGQAEENVETDYTGAFITIFDL
ncbi:MAG TPA: SBBP repeat-containing protein [bacterium]|nr:SBBP repeat-containing protein [bacterium]